MSDKAPPVCILVAKKSLEQVMALIRAGRKEEAHDHLRTIAAGQRRLPPMNGTTRLYSDEDALSRKWGRRR